MLYFYIRHYLDLTEDYYISVAICSLLSGLDDVFYYLDLAEGHYLN